MAKIEEDKKEKEEFNNQVYQLKREVEDLKAELVLAEQNKYEAEKNKEMLSQLYENNIIDEDGKPI